ncbi:pilin [Moraxella equi]|uniref:pilin n=1 Tax=Moraxella equi TaxID=60442 RepID=UPI0023EF4419|nr:pilin [Moraxella equi]
MSKSQTTRVSGELAAGKTAVDAALFEGKTPVLSEASSTSKENIGLTSSETSAKPRSNLMASVELTGFADNGAGTISATLGNKANKDIAKTVITQERTTDGVWTCKINGSQAAKYKEKFNPTGCTSN